MRIFAILLFLTSPVSALELKPDDEWINKLTQLCAAGMYGSRMTVEPICQELGQIIRQAKQATPAPDKK